MWATRWHARFVSEVGLSSWHESQLVLTALVSLAGGEADAGRVVLDDVFRRHSQVGLLEALRRYGNGRADCRSSGG